eukprot:TRINITY_DN12263_c0_g1_i8.p2 TRINITY_DN12263_c0_g1~~TRINITY_DN12263_c0_g1_i8.p2  ORF type:complete len:100 (+),score=24.86 TRINITY_DN12263_c0_g1_i8:203-502(+)
MHRLSIFFMLNGAIIGALSQINKTGGRKVAGGIVGFNSMYLLFFYFIEKHCVHARAMSEGKYAHHIRQQYIKEFPNTRKAKMYANFDKQLREKYDLAKY